MPANIDINQIIAPDVYGGIDKLNEKLLSSVTALQNIIKESEKVNQSFRDVKTGGDLQKATEQQRKVTEQLTAEQKAALQVSKQLEAAKAKLSAANSREAKTTAQLNAETKANEQATKKLADAKAKSASASSKETQETIKLNAETKAETQQKIQLANETVKLAQANSKEAKQIAELKAKQAQINKEISNAAKLAIANKDAINMNVKSIADLQKQTSSLIAIRRQQDLTTESGKKKYNELTAQINKNNKELKEYDKQIGVNNRNVGNYRDDIVSAFNQMGLAATPFGRIIAQASVVTKTFTKSTQENTAATESNALVTTESTAATTAQSAARSKGAVSAGVLTKANKVLRVSMLAIPVLAIVAAFVSLVQFFKRTEEGATKLQQVLAPFKVLFGNIGDILGDIGEKLFNTFSNPKKAVTDLWELIKENFVNRIKGVFDFWSQGFASARDLIKGFGLSIKGLFDKDAKAEADKYFESAKDNAKKMGESFTQVVTGVDEFGKKLKQGVENVKNAGKDFLEEQKREKEILNQLEADALALQKREREVLVENAKFTEQIAALRIKAKQEDRFSEEDRIKFLNQAIALEEQKLKNSLAIAEEELRIAKGKAALSDSDETVLKEIAQLEAAVYEQRAAFQKAQLRLETERQTLIRKLNAENTAAIKKELKEINDATEDAANIDLTTQIENQKQVFQKYRDRVNNTITDEKIKAETIKEINAQEVEYLDGIILQRQTKESAAIDESTNNKLTALQADVSNLEQYEKEKAKIIDDSENQKLNIELAALIARLENETVTGDEEIKIRQRISDIQVEQLEKQLTKEQQAIDDAIKQREQDYALETEQITANQQEQVLAVIQALKNREISYEDYQKRLQEIDDAAQQEQTDAFINYMQTLLDNEELTADERIEIENKIRDAKIKASQDATEKQIEDARRVEQETLQSIQNIIGVASQIGSDVNSIYDAQQKHVEDIYDKRLELAEGDAFKTQQIEREKARKIAEIQRKQAIIDRTTALFNIAINTAQSVSKVAAEAGLAAPILIPAYIALGIAQTAAVLAEPLPSIPAYAEGTDSAKGGISLVGERGREIVQNKATGETFLTPSVPTLIDLPKGAQVFTNEQTERILSGDIPQMKGFAANVNRSFMYNVAHNNNSPTRVDMSETNKELRKVVDAVKRIPRTSVYGNVDFVKVERQNSYMRKYFN